MTTDQFEPPTPMDGATDRPADAPVAPSRRALFRAGAALAAAALVPTDQVQAQRIQRPRGLTGLPPAPPQSGSTIARLVHRATMGLTAAELDKAKSMGYQRYLDAQLMYDRIDDSAVEAVVAQRYPAIAQAGTALYSQDVNLLYGQLAQATLYRAAFSKRQLFERMVEFWTDHFNINYVEVGYLKLLDDREVIRKHALGNFGDLLRASAHSAAMLEYLDNTRSRVGRVNQNYAREIMELHTMGADGGYTQADVEEVTRCFTGWTMQGRGDFRFDPTGHDFGAKTVLGKTFAAMPTSAGSLGKQDGDRVIDMLLVHPSTATFLSRKMIHWLLRYDPPEALVQKVAATYTRTRGDIKSMVREILQPSHVAAASLKFKRPFHYVVSAMRATGPAVTAVTQFAGRQMTLTGQPLFGWATPDGYPDRVEYWAGNILPRWNFTSTMMNATTGEVVVDLTPFRPTAPADEILTAIDTRLYGGEMPAATRARLRAFLVAQPITTTRVRETLALALSAPAFQWY